MSVLTRLALALCVFFGTFSIAATLKDGDALFEKEQYKEAKAIFEKFLKVGGDHAAHAAYRTVECELYLQRFGEAAQLASQVAIPTSGVWRGRLLFLRTQVYEQYLIQYGWRLNQASAAGNGDITQKTELDWERAIAKDFSLLWKERSQLAAIALTDEIAFLSAKGIDTQKYPNLWSFVVERWVRFLQTRSSSRTKAPFPTTLFNATGDWNPKSPRAQQAAQLFDSVAATNAAARQIWNAEKWLLPLSQPDWFEKAPKSLLPALKLLSEKNEELSDKRAKALMGAAIATGFANEKQFERAVALCKWVEKWDPQSASSQTCIGLRSRCEQPEIALNSPPLLPDVTQAIDITSRNLGTLYLRWLPISWDRLKTQRSASGDSGYYHLKTLELALLKEVAKEKSAYSWKINPQYPSKHEEAKSKVSVPPTKNGFHVLLVSEIPDFDSSKGLVRGALIRVSAMALVGSANPLNFEGLSAAANVKNPLGGFHLYAVDAKTGEGKAGWSISARQRLNWQTNSEVSNITDVNGRAHFADFPATYQSMSLDPLLKKDDTYALLENPLILYKMEADSTRLFLDLDRPIFRQGQKVQFKITAFARAFPGWKWRTMGEVAVTARNASGKEFYKNRVSLSTTGSVTGDFSLPTNGMLGSWTLEASLQEQDKTFQQTKSFAVEAYRRPELELTFEPLKEGKPNAPCRYSKPCEAVGRTVTYAGTALPGRAVNYRIVREPYYAFWDFWWRGPAQGGTEEVAAGTVTTAKDGSFRIPFVPKPFAEGEGAARFTITAETRELGGRTIAATKILLAGHTAFQIRAEATRGFIDITSTPEWNLKLEGLNGEVTSGEVEYHLYSLKLSDPAPADSLEAWLDKQKNAQAVVQGHAKVEGVSTLLKLKKLESGIYRLTLKARDNWGGVVETHRPVVVVNASDEVLGKTLPPSLTLAARKELKVGDNAEILLGSGEGKGVNFVEVWQGRNLIAIQTLPPGVRRHHFTVTEKNRGGMTVRWFSFFANRLYQGQVTLQVPWHDQEIKLSWKLPASSTPGSSFVLPLQAEDSHGKAVNGDGLLRVTDRALEYYAANDPLGAQPLFGPEPLPESFHDSHFAAAGSWLPTPSGWLEAKLGISQKSRELIQRREPSFPFETMRGHYANFGGGLGNAVRAMRGGAEPQSMADSREAAPMAMAAPATALKSGKTEGMKGDEKERFAPASRSDFSETAAFFPNVEFKDGKATLTIKFPDSLTSWKAEAFVSTAEGRLGYVTGTLSTQKPISVELSLTRFLREGDSAEFRGVIYNNTAKATAGKANFRLTRRGEAKSLIEKEFVVNVPAAEQKSFSLPIDSTLTLGDYSLVLSYQDGEIGDAVNKDLSLLPSRQVLVASDIALIEGDGKATLSTMKLGKDSILKSTTLAIEPNLAISVLGALPTLANPPALCLDGLLNRYVPLVAVKKLFDGHPELKKAAEALRTKTPNRQAWDLDDPRRLIAAQESPWALEAEGKATEAGLDLLDAKLVDRLAASTREGIKLFQREDGAFSWFAGGPSDLYMTLIALSHFVEARDLGVAFDESTEKRATQFLMKNLSEPDKTTELRSTLKLYTAYLVAALSEHYDWAKAYNPVIGKWLDEAEKMRSALTPLGRAYAARALFHIGKAERANVYLNRLLSDAVDDPITGLSWKLEEFSWLWYHDSLDKHLFVLRTLLKVRPKDPKITSLVRGLFWQKKGNKWKSARHSAGAILAMVDYLKNAGAFTSSVTAAWNWGDDKGKNTWEPLDENEKSLVLTQKDPKKAFLSAQIEKTGPGFAVASLTTLFESSSVAEGQGNLLNLKRQFYLRQKRNGQNVLLPLKIGDAVNVGDVVEVEMTLKSRSQFEYLQLKSPRGAGFEPEDKLSGWKWDGVNRYQEIQDSLDQIFISWMPNGTFRFRFPLRATIGGKFQLQSAVVQSMYSPDISSFTESGELLIKPELTSERIAK